MIRQIFFGGLGAIISLLSLLAGSGIGQVYKLYPTTRIVVTVLFLVLAILSARPDKTLRKREIILFFGLFCIIGLWPMIQGNGMEGFEYGFLLLIPYVLGSCELRQRDIRALSLACGGVGLAVVVARLYLGVFENWNANDIAIAGFFGSAVMSAAPWTTRRQRLFHCIYLYLVMMGYLVYKMDSRSCLIGLILLALVALDILKPDWFARNTLLRRMILLAPAVIALGVVLFQNMPLFDILNQLSVETFGKPIFNGRNDAWEYGFMIVKEHPLLGSGHINNGYWHNCAISALTAFGIVGYILWLCYFENILLKAQRWSYDPCICCCVTSFLIIMFQQSFELGLISTTGSMLPYVLLGIILGRIRHLKHRDGYPHRPGSIKREGYADGFDHYSYL